MPNILNVNEFVVAAGGTTFNVNDYDTYDLYVISGSAAITADNDIVFVGTPIANMEFNFQYIGNCTNGGGTVVVFGRALTDVELAHPQDISVIYDGVSAWDIGVFPSSETGSIDGANIANGSIPSAAFADTFWKTTGNAGTTAGTNFLGTTDAQDVVFKRNSVWAGLISLANTFFGVNAGLTNSTGSGNVAIGDGALELNSAGNNNTATGQGALAVNLASGNTATGSSSLANNTTGGSNTADGINALTANTLGSFNTAGGVQALGANTTGSSNTAYGRNAGGNNTTGSGNTSFGEGAGSASTGGTERMAFGKSAAPTKDYQFVLPSNTVEVDFYKANLRTGAVTNNHTPVSANATATLTAAQVLAGFIISTSAAATVLTLPTGTLLGAALSAIQGTVHKFYIDNTAGANNVTIAVSTNAILSALAAANAATFGELVIPSGATGTAEFTIVFSSSTAYTFSRTA